MVGAGNRRMQERARLEEMEVGAVLRSSRCNASCNVRDTKSGAAAFDSPPLCSPALLASDATVRVERLHDKEALVAHARGERVA